MTKKLRTAQPEPNVTGSYEKKACNGSRLILLRQIFESSVENG